MESNNKFENDKQKYTGNILLNIAGGTCLGVSYMLWSKISKKHIDTFDMGVVCLIGSAFPTFGVSMGLTVGSYYYMTRKPNNIIKYLK